MPDDNDETITLDLSDRDCAAIGAALSLALAQAVDDPILADKMLGLVKLALSPVEVGELAESLFEAALSFVSGKDKSAIRTHLLSEFLETRNAEKKAMRESPDYPSSSTEGAD